MMRAFTRMIVALVLGTFILALSFTIIGSSTGHDGLLAAGIIAWFAATCLLFLLMVLVMWSRRKRYRG